MNGVALFTDVSLDPARKIGVGACLAVPASLMEVPPQRIETSAAAERIVIRRFKDTSSTRLEVQTVLWALEDFRNELKASGPAKLQVYSDSQCVAGLLRRRHELEANDFVGKGTNRPLKNASLYRKFYEFRDELGFEVIKVAGHSISCSHNNVLRIFSFVDKKARQELKLWLGELKRETIESITRDCRTLNSTDKSNNGNWCVYILRCRNNFLYTGLTNNIDRRLKEHELGTGSKFVRSRRPFELLKTITCNSAEEARKLEYHLKRLTRSRKIEVLGLGIEPSF